MPPGHVSRRRSTSRFHRTLHFEGRHPVPTSPRRAGPSGALRGVVDLPRGDEGCGRPPPPPAVARASRRTPPPRDDVHELELRRQDHRRLPHTARRRGPHGRPQGDPRRSVARAARGPGQGPAATGHRWWRCRPTPRCARRSTGRTRCSSVGHRALPWSRCSPVQHQVVARILLQAFTPMPMHTNWAGIDDIVFVSPHSAPCASHRAGDGGAPVSIRSPTATSHALPAAQAPRRGGRLGLLGWNNVTKDPAWASTCWRPSARATSGGAYGSSGSNFDQQPHRSGHGAYRDAAPPHGALGDAVERPGFGVDVPEALRHVGVILKPSRREGAGPHPGGGRQLLSPSCATGRTWRVEAVPGRCSRMSGSSRRPVRCGPRPGGGRAGAIGERATSLAEWTLGRYDWSVVRPQMRTPCCSTGPARETEDPHREQTAPVVPRLGLPPGGEVDAPTACWPPRTRSTGPGGGSPS